MDSNRIETNHAQKISSTVFLGSSTSVIHINKTEYSI